MREIIEDITLGLLLGVGLRLLHDMRHLRNLRERIYRDDDGELLPITVVSDEDERVN
jgi:hypothetical protein